MFERGTLSRRGFINRSTVALAGAGLPLWFAGETARAEDAKKDGKDDTIKVGIIGIGSNGAGSKGSTRQSRARQLVREIQNLKRSNIRITAACDVDARHLEEGAVFLKEIGHPVAAVKDFRELNDMKELDAVIVATPDHWHALCAIDAMKKGKHVYCEKPLTLTVAEAPVIVKVQKETNRVFQTGNQQRSDYRGMFRLACDLVRNGRVGKVKRIECRIGANEMSESITEVKPPAELDWNFWLGPTPETPYLAQMQKGGFKTNCHYDFRWWYTWSGGKMTDWGAHHLDIAQWALDMDFNGPVTVEGKGTDPNPEPRTYNCHRDFEVKYTYGNGVEVLAMSKGENGVKIEGEDGRWIFVGRGRIGASDEKLIKEELPASAPRLPVSGGHMANFFNCLKTGEKPICHAGVGASSVTICHIGTIALRLGGKFHWDAKAQKFAEKEANAMLSRQYRSPWKLEA